MKTKVLQTLKPKVASLGFTKEELESVVDTISGTLQEDATEEQINAQIDAVIPYLKLSQTAVTRIVNAKKKEEQQKAPKASTTTQEAEEGADPEDKFEKLLKVIEAQNEKIDALVNKDVKTSRREVYVSKLKDLPEFIQKSKLKDFDRMNFKDQEDFDSFIQETETDIPVIKQAIADSELSEMEKPFLGKKNQNDEEAFIEMMKSMNSEEKEK
ncbi:MAG: hypothetical protein PHG06_23930 [Parabacteroides sp.]|nr:hypothetical protein [Parabacteroides sp.]